MDTKKIVMTIIKIAVRIVIVIVIISAATKLAFGAYDFGFKIFADIPMARGNGREVEVTIPMGKSVLETGEILKDKGLIEDEKIFYCQELLSAHHGKLNPGFYTLSTSMTAEEMLQIMSEESETEEESDG